MRSRRFEPPIITGVFSIRYVQEGFHPVTMNALIGDRRSRDGCYRRYSGQACKCHCAEDGKHITHRQHDGDVFDEANVEKKRLENTQG